MLKSAATTMRAVAGIALLGLVLSTVPTGTAALAAGSGSQRRGGSPHLDAAGASGTSTVWLCRPGMAGDPCAFDLTTTVVQPSYKSTVVRSPADTSASKFDCFFVYPTASKQKTTNANLKVQKPEIDAAIYEAARFSTVCRVWAPMYRQVTVAGLEAHPTLNLPASATDTAYDSIRTGLKDYLAHDNDGRPIIFIGHSQGAAMLILLLERLVDHDPALRDRMLLAVILGGNVEVKPGSLSGGTFSNIPLCSHKGEVGCVIAYSTFPGTPPTRALFGRPGQGVSLQSGQTKRSGLGVACVNPAAVGGGSGTLLPYFTATPGVTTPWVEYPRLYSARCEHRDGASWLQVHKVTGASDHRPLVAEPNGPDWGYHAFDVNLALGNLVADVAAAEATWLKRPPAG